MPNITCQAVKQVIKRHRRVTEGDIPAYKIIQAYRVQIPVILCEYHKYSVSGLRMPRVMVICGGLRLPTTAFDEIEIMFDIHLLEKPQSR